jgi:hypothetical protein
MGCTRWNAGCWVRGGRRGLQEAGNALLLVVVVVVVAMSEEDEREKRDAGRLRANLTKKARAAISCSAPPPLGARPLIGRPSERLTRSRLTTTGREPAPFHLPFEKHQGRHQYDFGRLACYLSTMSCAAGPVDRAFTAQLPKIEVPAS